MGVLETAMGAAWLTALLVWIWKHVYQFIKENWSHYLWMLIPSYEFYLQDDRVCRWLSENVFSFRKIDWYSSHFPGVGYHPFKTECGTWMLLHVELNSNNNYILTLYSYKSSKWIHEWVKAKNKHVVDVVRKYVEIFVYNGACFRRIPEKEIRKPETLIFKNDVHMDILKSVQKFIDEPSRFKDYGISKSKGYCLHGPPGSGKTSIPMFVAGQTGKTLVMIRPEAICNTDFFIDIHSRAKESIFIFDDVDILLKRRPDGSNKADTEVYQQNLDKLLALLDSPMTPEGLIFFMTTNHPEVLDPALIRPGRVDEKFLIDHPGPEEVIKLFKVVYPEEDPQAFMDAYGDRKLSPAAILGFLIRQGNIKACIDNIHLIDDMLSKANLNELSQPSYLHPYEGEPVGRLDPMDTMPVDLELEGEYVGD